MQVCVWVWGVGSVQVWQCRCVYGVGCGECAGVAVQVCVWVWGVGECAGVAVQVCVWVWGVGSVQVWQCRCVYGCGVWQCRCVYECGVWGVCRCGSAGVCMGVGGGGGSVQVLQCSIHVWAWWYHITRMKTKGGGGGGLKQETPLLPMPSSIHCVVLVSRVAPALKKVVYTHASTCTDPTSSVLVTGVRQVSYTHWILCSETRALNMLYF